MACSGPERGACGGRGSLQLLRNLVLGLDALIARDVADYLLAEEVVLVTRLTLARMLTRRGGVGIRIRVEEVGLREGASGVGLIACLVGGPRCRGGLVVGPAWTRHDQEPLPGADPVADAEQLLRVAEQERAVVADGLGGRDEAEG